MAVRDLVGVGLLGVLGYMALKAWNGPVLQAPANLATGTADTYLTKLAMAESGGRPYVKAASSSASGLYQFIKSTWVSMGGAWGEDKTKPFGGLTPSIAEQTQRAAMLTEQNVQGLMRAGIAVSNPTLYAAHFLGLDRAINVLKSPPSTPVASLLPASVIKANPFLKGLTVAGFLQTMQRKVGA